MGGAGNEPPVSTDSAADKPSGDALAEPAAGVEPDGGGAAAPTARGNEPAPRTAAAPDGGAEPVATSDDDSDADIPLCAAAAPPAKKRRVVEAKTSSVEMTASERYRRDDAGCAARLREREEANLHSPLREDAGPDDAGLDMASRFQGYDGFSIPGRQGLF